MLRAEVEAVQDMESEDEDEDYDQDDEELEEGEVRTSSNAQPTTPMTAPARPSSKTLDAGGLSMALRRHFCTSTFRHLAARPEQAAGLDQKSQPFTPGLIHSYVFAVMQWWLKGVTIILIGVYLSNAMGLIWSVWLALDKGTVIEPDNTT